MIEMRHAGKTYPTTRGAFAALTDVSLRIERSEFVAIVGQSGSGKSTLLNLLAGLDRPTSGDVLVDGRRIGGLSEREASVWRGVHVGIVFQFFQLLPTLTIAENVMLPMDLCGRWPRRERPARALHLLDRLGIADQADKRPAALSGGQQQRAAVARALANDPKVLFADEPTGNLDSRTARETVDLLATLAQDGRAVVMVTHDLGARTLATRTIMLSDGRIVTEEERSRLEASPRNAFA
jgi:putative ABC transport system ATP-binding protein